MRKSAKSSDLFPRGSAKGGPSFSRPAIGESALQISSSICFSKNVPEAVPIFAEKRTAKSRAAMGECFASEKHFFPRGSANSGRKKGDPPREFPILKLSIFRARRHAPVCLDLASGLATTRLPVRTLPSRAHPQDYGRRRSQTPSN